MAQPEDSAREPLMPDDSAHGELGGRGDKTLKSFKAWMARPSVATLAVAVVLIGVSCGVVAVRQLRSIPRPSLTQPVPP